MPSTGVRQTMYQGASSKCQGWVYIETCTEDEAESGEQETDLTDENGD